VARLLIVADVVGLSLLLADVHEVVVGSGDLDDLAVDEAGRVDALVVGPRDPMRVLTALETLRKEGVTLPVLVVAGYQPSWARMTTVPYEGVLVMQPPITQEPLLEAVAELLPDDPASRRRRPQPPDEFAALPEPDTLSLPRPMLPPTVPGWEEDTVPFAVPRLDHGADAPEEPLTPPAVPVESTAPADPAVPVESTMPTEPGAPAEPDDGREAGPGGADGEGQGRSPRSRLGLLGRNRQEAGGQALERRLGPVTYAGSLGPGGTSPELVSLGFNDAPAEPVTETRDALDEDQDEGTDADAVPGPNGTRPSPAERRVTAQVTAEQPTDRTGHAWSSSDLVRLLSRRVEEVYGVQDAAQAIAEELVERTDADAGVVLVPDGPVWRVSGGVGLRPIERRLTLTASHWVIAQTVGTERGIIVEDTDAVRSNLTGAPLAAWRHLLGVPVPTTRVLALLARSGETEPFTERDLTTVLGVARDAAAVFRDAVEARALARLLAPLRDEVPGG